MREIVINNKQIRVKATALTLLYYKQAFGTDLIADLIKLEQIGRTQQIDAILCLQIIWAMAKSEQYGKSFPSFESWLSDLGDIDFSDPKFILDTMEEATTGFFRGFQGKQK